MTSRTHWFASKIASEESCCPAGHLRLCLARGETPNGIAENLGLSPHTIWYQLRKLRKSEIKCQRRSDCMKGIIDEIKKNPPKRVLEARENTRLTSAAPSKPSPSLEPGPGVQAPDNPES